MRGRGLLFALGLMAAGPVAALELALPANARLTVERDTALDSYTAPVGVFAQGAVPGLDVEGTVTRRVWRIDAQGLTTLQVLAPLRTQIEAAGYDVIFECRSAGCGGFDFRFAIETLPGPNMYVNLRAFRVLTAVRGDPAAPEAVVSVLASTAATSAYVQVIEAGKAAAAPAALLPPEVPAPSASPPVVSGAPAAQALLENGHLVLRDLDFASGNAALGPGPFATLDALALFLTENPKMRLSLVGHTDTVGGLAPNIALSRDRARAVRTRLIEKYGVNAARVDAEGVGYLSPVASNLDAAGREANRRVEAILLGAP